MQLSLLALLVLLPNLASAQQVRSSIAGRVTNAGQQPVRNASVSLLQEDTNRSRTATTNIRGEFFLTLLPAGSYRLDVSSSGFRTSTQTILLQLDQEVTADIPLLPEKSNERVEVTASLLKTESAAMSTVIDNRQIRNLPLDGRNFYELSLLAPGSAPAAPGSAGSDRGDFALNIGGAREDANNFLLDGIYNGDPKLNGFAVTPPVDAVREFEVLTNSYDAGFGRNSGGQINVILQSGTNRLHGSVYEFLRNAALDGTNYFAPAGVSPKNIRNQFGATLGGPIRKENTFFFLDYEGRRIREGITRTTNVPTAAERTGDFSKSGLQLIPIDIFTQQPFPNFIIPRTRMSPTALAVAALYPLPNRSTPGRNFVASPVQTDRADHFDVRADHHVSKSSELAFRYSFEDRDFYEPFGAGGSSASIPGFGNNIPRRAQNILLSETHTFSSNLWNELRLGFNRISLQVNQQNQNNDLNKAVGIPNLSSNSRDRGLTQIGVNGFSSLGDELNNPQSNASNTWQVNDNLRWNYGRHLFQAGFDVRVAQQNGFSDVESRGIINFTGFTGNALAEMLQDVVSYSIGAKVDNAQHLRTQSTNVYAQDTVRLLENLTLIFGLRYEYNTPAVDAFDRANIYDPATHSIVPVGKNGIPRAGYQSDRNNFAPRAGLAWAPSRNWVVRMGYGVYYDMSPFAPGEGLFFSPPYFKTQIYIPSQQTPVILENPFPANYPGFIPNSAFAFQRDLKTPYVQQWNVGIQRQLDRANVVELAYAGAKGTKLIANRDINQARPSTQQPNLRPNFYFSDIDTYESRSNSSYHSLQARLTRRLQAGLSGLASYTWSKSIDDASGFFSSGGDPAFPQDSNNTRGDRGRSNFDVRHRFTAGYSYDLPVRSKNIFLAGWQTNGVWTFQSGRPFTVTLLPGVDNSNTGIPSIGYAVVDRPNVVADPNLSSRTPDRWFNTSAFVTPRYGSFGNAGRNILTGPGAATVNFSLIKNTTLREGMTLQFRAEIYNLLDRANFNLPDSFVGSPSFGRVLSAGDPRRAQFGLKLLF